MISVIVPIFNSEKYLSDLINDLLQQTYKDFELILIDDGSTDNSGMIAQRYMSADNRIRYFRTDHCGVSAVRNIGLKQSKGNYIRFIDADDRLEPDSIEKLVQAMENDKEIDLVCGRFETDNAGIDYLGPPGAAGKRNIESFIQDFSFAPWTFYYGVVWNKLYRRELIYENNIFFDENIDWCEDFLFNLKYYEHCKYIYYLQETVYKYYTYDGSLSSEANKKLEKKDIIDRYRYQKAVDFIEKFGCNSELFKDTWAYLKTMRKLNTFTNIFSSRRNKRMSICESYQFFKGIIILQDIKELFGRRYAEDSDVMVKMIYKSIKRERYVRLFIIMIVKDFMSVHCAVLKKLWRKRKRRGGDL